MIDAKDAAQIAAKYYREISNSEGNLSIEEVELDETENCWFITLGIVEPNPLSYRIGRVTPDQYKIFKISRESGNVLSMKIRILK